MLKIALLFLFCAISGYGINGLPNDTKVSIQPENNTPISVVGEVGHINDTKSNGKATPPQLPSSSSPVTMPDKTVTELHKNAIVMNTASTEKNNFPTTKTEIVDNVSTNIPINKSLPNAAENSAKISTDNLNLPVTPTGLLSTTGSPAATESPAAAVPTISSQNKPSIITIIPKTSTAAPVVPDTPVVPVSAPKAGKWVVNESNQTCIIVNMAVQFNVSYINKANETVSELFNLPDSANDTVVTGECGKSEQYIRLSFNDTKNVTSTFTVHFVKNETAKQYSLHNLEVVLLNPNNTVVLEHNTTLVSTGLSNSYRCLKQQNFTLTQNGTDKIMGYFLMSDLQFQAFKTDNNKDFGEVKDCKLDTPDIVPIAVGCALAGLVVIVLIAYLMGRRRSQGHGYLSM